MGLREQSERLGAMQRLDPLADGLQAWVRPVRGTPVWDALRGRWLGHPLHAVLTDAPIGLWTSAVTLDWVGGPQAQRSADLLTGLGAAAALPTAAAGLADWSEAPLKARRQGLAHAGLNTLALALFLASLALRPVNRASGRRLALLAYAVLLAGGYLGAHLAYVEGVGVDRRAAMEPLAPPAGPAEDPGAR